MDCDLSREINLGICGTLFLQIPLASGKASLVPDETSVLLSRVLDSETTTCVRLERGVDPPQLRPILRVCRSPCTSTRGFFPPSTN